jgi:hypothetical protein
MVDDELAIYPMALVFGIEKGTDRKILCRIVRKSMDEIAKVER